MTAAAGGPTLQALVPWLDDLLQVAVTPDYTGAMNGLQFDHAGPVIRVAAAVDASLRSIEAAVAAHANLLIVHHGLFWAGAQAIRGTVRRKYKLMLDHDIAVYSSHLPLDRHPVHGNNALLASALSLEPTGTWHPYKGVPIGIVAEADITTKELVSRARAFSAMHGHHVVATAHDDHRVSRRIAICSGGGASSDSIREACAIGADTLVVGEGPHHTAIDAEESGLVIIYAGHYATETLGVQSIARVIAEQWQLPWVFLPAPTGL
ncbi:MAG TPA: Nif3-like dinuclear metal center hexameric protein [Gemmatimonadaceae bacterium]|nr:Nif3-like dinuclear metal center hexameric protein [Gemmatimonadaceae bacterium]